MYKNRTAKLCQSSMDTHSEGWPLIGPDAFHWKIHKRYHTVKDPTSLEQIARIPI